MTIIEPQRHRLILNPFLIGLVLIVAAGGIGSIVLYNETVRLDHLIQAAREEARVLEVETGEAQRELATLLDAPALERAAIELGLAPVAPAYLAVPTVELAADSRPFTQ